MREVEALGAVDGEHLHGVLGPFRRPALLRFAARGDVFAQRPQHRGDVAAALFELDQQAAEEALEIGQVIAAEVARGGRRVEQQQPPQPLDEDVRRLGGEGFPQHRQLLDRGQQAELPPRHPLQARHSRGQLAGCRLDRPADHRERFGGRPVQLGQQARQLVPPQRQQGGVRHADRRRAQGGDQRQVVPGVEHGAHQRRRVDDLAPAVVLLVPSDREGDAGAAQGVEVDLEIAGRAQQDRRVTPGHRVPLVEIEQVGGDRLGLERGRGDRLGRQGLAVAHRPG